MNGHTAPLLAAITAALIIAPAAPQATHTAETMLEAARQKETLEGDLKGAIKQYSTVVARYAKTDRSVAAKALVRMAECYQEMGDTEARKIFEQVVRDYADQKEAVAEARAKLGASRGIRSVGIAARQIWIARGSEDPAGHVPSPDGRFICFTDWETGDLGVRDLSTGINRRLTNTGGWEASGDYVENSVISSDGSQIAYAWFMEKEKRHEIRTLLLVGGTPRTVWRGDHPRDYMDLKGWGPDGKQILAIRTLPDATTQLVLVSLENGSVRSLKSFNWQRVNAAFSSDGRYIAVDSPAGSNNQTLQISVLAADGSRETVLHEPANNGAPLWSPDGSRIVFISDRTGGHSLWTVPIADGEPAGPAELIKADVAARSLPLGLTRTGTLYYTQPGIAGTNVYTADLDASGKVSGKPRLASESFLNSNTGPALSPDGKLLAYYSNVHPGEQTPGALVIRTVATGEERRLPVQFVGALFGHGPEWFPNGHSMLTLAIQPGQAGFSLNRIDLDSGKTEVLLRVKNFGFQGYSLSPDGKSIYCSAGTPDGENHRLLRFDIESRQETELRKGEWYISPTVSPDGKYLAYLVSVRPGPASYLAVIPTTGGEPREVFRGSPWMDGSRYNTLSWSPDQRYLLFVRGGVGDKTPNVLWRVPIAGGPAEQMGLSLAGRIKSPQIYPDGRRIVFGVQESGASELWALENFLPPKPATK